MILIDDLDVMKLFGFIELFGVKFVDIDLKIGILGIFEFGMCFVR